MVDLYDFQLPEMGDTTLAEAGKAFPGFPEWVSKNAW